MPEKIDRRTLYRAKKLYHLHGVRSISHIQRRLCIGYETARRLVKALEDPRKWKRKRGRQIRRIKPSLGR